MKALGCESFNESKNNICYAMKKAKTLSIIGLGDLEKSQAVEAVDFIKSKLDSGSQTSVITKSVLSEEFDFDALRKCDKVMILVRAGAKNGKMLERAIEQIRRQDLEIAGAFLFSEDKKLIKQYYR